MTLTSEWDGTYVFYDDGTFGYKESGSEEVTLKGTYTGNPSKDGELKLSVTSGYWNGAWSAPDNDYGIYFEIEGDSFTGYDWWMEDGEEVKDEENPKTFTKVEEEKEPETEDGTTEEAEPVDVSAYVGTWECGWNDGDWYGYIVIESDGTFYYWSISSGKAIGDVYDASMKGTVTDVTDSTLTVSNCYYWNTSNSNWYTSSSSDTISMEITNQGEATAKVVYSSYDKDLGTFTKQE